ncbi:6898_t:CDS:2 [Entrophospora sp. SA101]|nr:6898_t:CDS:2 [Entrophospora sp. SA101]
MSCYEAKMAIQFLKLEILRFYLPSRPKLLNHHKCHLSDSLPEVTNTCIPASINDLTARLTVLDQWRIGHGILVLLLLRKSRTCFNPASLSLTKFGNGTTYYILTIASFSTSLTSLQNLDSDMRCNLEPQSLQLKYPESDFVSFKIYKTFAIETFGYLSKQSFNYVKLV